MIVKATEMFISDITSTSQKFAKVNGRKTIHLQDLKSAYLNFDQFYFIKDSHLPALNVKKEESKPI